MVNKVEIDMAINILQSIIALIEKIDPQAANNKIVIDINRAIESIKALGL